MIKKISKGKNSIRKSRLSKRISKDITELLKFYEDPANKCEIHKPVEGEQVTVGKLIFYLY